jgi:hypothetical protein
MWFQGMNGRSAPEGVYGIKPPILMTMFWIVSPKCCASGMFRQGMANNSIQICNESVAPKTFPRKLEGLEHRHTIG